MNDDPGRMAGSWGRSLATVRRTMAIVTRVIRKNRELAKRPGHRQSAEQRISEGQQELIQLESEQGQLEAAMRREHGPG